MSLFDSPQKTGRLDTLRAWDDDIHRAVFQLHWFLSPVRYVPGARRTSDVTLCAVLFWIYRKKCSNGQYVKQTDSPISRMGNRVFLAWRESKQKMGEQVRNN